MNRSPSFVEVDVGVVGELRREHRTHPLEERAAWVRRELRVGDPALVARRAIGAALEEAIGVGNVAVREREAVQHREAVEPMVHGSIADLPFGRAGAKQRSLEPGRKLAPHGETVEMRLLLERIEAAAGVGEGRECCVTVLIMPPESFVPNRPDRTVWSSKPFRESWALRFRRRTSARRRVRRG